MTGNTKQASSKEEEIISATLETPVLSICIGQIQASTDTTKDAFFDPPSVCK
jgi:hypothetical protein